MRKCMQIFDFQSVTSRAGGGMRCMRKIFFALFLSCLTFSVKAQDVDSLRAKIWQSPTNGMS